MNTRQWQEKWGEWKSRFDVSGLFFSYLSDAMSDISAASQDSQPAAPQAPREEEAGNSVEQTRVKAPS